MSKEKESSSEENKENKFKPNISRVSKMDLTMEPMLYLDEERRLLDNSVFSVPFSRRKNKKDDAIQKKYDELISLQEKVDQSLKTMYDEYNFLKEKVDKDIVKHGEESLRLLKESKKEGIQSLNSILLVLLVLFFAIIFVLVYFEYLNFQSRLTPVLSLFLGALSVLIFRSFSFYLKRRMEDISL